ncbi:hypothetical protein [Pseudochelatococcus sp. G4_1912]|uniref:hypothetical protein n=1 Tax=Pseudochelatococcus sp. G4_1912 TaxID=3114288 RepID=UPI0039C6DF86
MADEINYQEREAVAVFSDEASLNAAVDELMQLGLRQEDMSLLASTDKLPSGISTDKLEDADNVPHAAYVSPDSRTEGLAALVGGPAVMAGLGAAAIIGTGGAALIPTLCVTVGSTIAGGSLGLIMARAFGRKHAEHIQTQIMNGGLLLWVHAPESSNDAKIIEILKRNSGRDVHFHVVNRTWGVADVPLHSFNPDPLLSN